jgi:3D (Asp-Asp-Asp) domain-containing protein
MNVIGDVVVWALITSYCPSYACGALDHGITTSGRRAVEGYTIACPPDLPFDTRVLIEGVGLRTCEDRGSAIQGRHLDLFFGSMTESDRGLRRAIDFSRFRQTRRVRIVWRPDAPTKLPPWDPNHSE